jgi:hypothetical protein
MNNKISIQKQHDWISVIFGRHRLTVSYSGFKASGAVPNSLFDLWVAAMDAKPAALAMIGIMAVTNKGDTADAFAKAIPTLWPDYSKEPYIPAIGARVQCNFGKRKGIDQGTVIGIKRNYVDVQWDRSGRMSVQFDMLIPAA